jgi:hypothetical protein
MEVLMDQDETVLPKKTRFMIPIHICQPFPLEKLNIHETFMYNMPKEATSLLHFYFLLSKMTMMTIKVSQI